jgi:hypothetical protein
MLAGEIFDLSSLSTDNLWSMVDLCVNELLILNIDQWSEEEGASTEEGQAPKREDLDEVVGDERRSECLRRVELGSVTKGEIWNAHAYSNRDDWVLSEQDALEFNDEEVDQLFEIVKGGFEGLLGDLVVSARSEAASNSSAHDKFAGDLSKSSNYKPRLGLLRPS